MKLLSILEEKLRILKKSKLLALILAVAVVLSRSTVTAFAESNSNVKVFTNSQNLSLYVGSYSIPPTSLDNSNASGHYTCYYDLVLPVYIYDGSSNEKYLTGGWRQSIDLSLKKPSSGTISLISYTIDSSVLDPDYISTVKESVTFNQVNASTDKLSINTASIFKNYRIKARSYMYSLILHLVYDSTVPYPSIDITPSDGGTNDGSIVISSGSIVSDDILINSVVDAINNSNIDSEISSILTAVANLNSNLIPSIISKINLTNSKLDSIDNWLDQIQDNTFQSESILSQIYTFLLNQSNISDEASDAQSEAADNYSENESLENEIIDNIAPSQAAIETLSANVDTVFSNISTSTNFWHSAITKFKNDCTWLWDLIFLGIVIGFVGFILRLIKK